MAKKPRPLPPAIADEIRDCHLPTGGACPFEPTYRRSPSGTDVLRRGQVEHGPKRGKTGFLDRQGRIWIRDPAHAGVPDHWDVQTDGGRRYDRVGDDGSYLS